MSASDVVQLHQRDEALVEEARIAARLVPAIREGDPAAESELVERYSRGLSYLLTRKCGDRERARDLLQETFCIAFEKLRNTDLDNPERLAGYLRGIAVRVALNAGRKRDREPDSMDDQLLIAIPDDMPRQFEQIDADERAAAIRELLESLPVERDRDLLLRFYVYDQGKAEICQALTLDSLHFNRVLFRAKGRFRKVLEASGRLRELTPK